MKKIKKIVYVAPIVTIGGVELYANDESWTWSQFAGNVVGGAVGGAAGAVAGTAVASGSSRARSWCRGCYRSCCGSRWWCC